MYSSSFETFTTFKIHFSRKRYSSLRIFFEKHINSFFFFFSNFWLFLHSFFGIFWWKFTHFDKVAHLKTQVAPPPYPLKQQSSFSFLLLKNSSNLPWTKLQPPLETFYVDHTIQNESHKCGTHPCTCNKDIYYLIWSGVAANEYKLARKLEKRRRRRKKNDQLELWQ